MNDNQVNLQPSFPMYEVSYFQDKLDVEFNLPTSDIKTEVFNGNLVLTDNYLCISIWGI